LLASAFLLQSASSLLIVANYTINRDYISKNLCENRAKPNMHCNGKCHLKKQLQKEEKKENSSPGNMKNKSELQFFSVYQTPLIIAEPAVQSKCCIRYLFAESQARLHAVFHPPRG